MVRKDGRVLDVLLDADLDTDFAGSHHTLAALRESHDHAGWQYPLAVLRALLGLARVRRAIETILAGEASAADSASAAMASVEHGDPPEDTVAGGQAKVVDDLLEAVGEVSESLNALRSILAGSAFSKASEQKQLVLLAENVVKFCGKLPWLSTWESAEEP